MKKAELLTKIKDANWFIIEIAKMLNIDTDGVGYDDCQLTLEDFQEAIKNLPNEPKTVSNNELTQKVCDACGCTKSLIVEKCCECGNTLNIHGKLGGNVR